MMNGMLGQLYQTLLAQQNQSSQGLLGPLTANPLRLSQALRQRETANTNLMPAAQGQDRHGFPIDLSRPKIPVDGGYQTEYSITEQLPDGRWYNLPSIWDGKALNPETQIQDILSRALQEKKNGWMFPNFSSLEDALKAAPQRSKDLESWRKN